MKIENHISISKMKYIYKYIYKNTYKYKNNYKYKYTYKHKYTDRTRQRSLNKLSLQAKPQKIIKFI